MRKSSELIIIFVDAGSSLIATSPDGDERAGKDFNMVAKSCQATFVNWLA